MRIVNISDGFSSTTAPAPGPVVGTTFQASPGSLGAPSFAFVGYATSGFFYDAGALRVVYAGNERFQVNGTGAIVSGSLTVTDTVSGKFTLGTSQSPVGCGIANPSSADQIHFYTASSAKGSVSQSGSWTLGVVGASSGHTVYGRTHLADVAASTTATQLTLEGRYSGYGAGLSLSSRTTDAGTLVDMARITATGESAWNGTASTQDAQVSIATSINGALVERYRISTTATGHTWYRAVGALAATLNEQGSFILGDGGLAYNGTDGFLYLAATNGPPAGTPTSYAGRYPLNLDYANNELKVYNGGWVKVNSKGTTTNDAAAEGYIGQYVESKSSTFASWPVATGLYRDVTTIELTAGDWDVTGIALFYSGAGTNSLVAGISTGATGNTFTDREDAHNTVTLADMTANDLNSVALTIPNVRLSLSATTVVRLKGAIYFTSGSPTCAYRLSARRMR